MQALFFAFCLHCTHREKPKKTMSRQKKVLQAQEWFKLTNMGEGSSDAELTLFGYIGEWEAVNYHDLINAIEQLPDSVKTLKLVINSQGGEVYEGNTIYTSLQLLKRNRGLYIETHVYLACSMAGVLALVGDKIVGYSGSVWHAHEVKGGAWGGSKSLRQTADHIDQLTDTLAQRYANRTGIDKEVIKSEWMGDGVEKYFTAKEAFDVGLFDEVIDLDMPMPANKIGNKELHNAFNSILNLGESPAKPTDTVMDINKINSGLEAAGLGNLLNGVNTEEALVNFITKMKSDHEAELTNARTELDALKDAQAKKEQEQKEAKAEGLVNKAIEDKKIPASQKEVYLNLAKSDYDSAETALSALPKPKNVQAFINNEEQPEKEPKKDPLIKNKAQEQLLAMQKASRAGKKA